MSVARSRALGWSIRIWLALVCIGPGFGGVLRSEPVREALKDSEWFDYSRDDYHQYRPEEIEIPDRWQCQSSEQQIPLGAGDGVAVFLNALVYLVLAAAAGLILYLIFRVLQERRSQPEFAEELAAAMIDHRELPADLAMQAGMREPLNSKRLRELIEASFAAGDLRAACIYIYLFALLRFSTQGVIELKGDRTARDYTLQLERVPAEGGADFRAVARLFEFALYRGRLPADATAESVMSLWRGLASDAATGKNRGGAVA